MSDLQDKELEDAITKLAKSMTKSFDLGYKSAKGNMYVVELLNVVNDHRHSTPKYLISGLGDRYQTIEGVDKIGSAAKYDTEDAAINVAQSLFGTIACTWVAISVENSLARKLPQMFEIHEQRKRFLDDSRRT